MSLPTKAVAKLLPSRAASSSRYDVSIQIHMEFLAKQLSTSAPIGTNDDDRGKVRWQLRRRI